MRHLLTISLSLLLICLVTPVLADEGIIIRMSAVYDKASSSSRQVAQIEAGSRVSVFERQGGWKLIFSDEKALTGWVRSYQVRSGSYTETPKVETKPDSRGFLAGLASFSRKASSFFGGGNSTSSAKTATIGVRGLSEEEIKSAVPDFKELGKMALFASSNDRMPAFGDGGHAVITAVRKAASDIPNPASIASPLSAKTIRINAPNKVPFIATRDFDRKSWLAVSAAKTAATSNGPMVAKKVASAVIPVS